MLIQILQILAARDPTFIERLAAHDRPSNRVRFIARSQGGLNNKRPEIAEKNSKEFAPGWWVYSKYSRADIAEKIALAAKVAHITHGIDLRINLGGSESADAS